MQSGERRLRSRESGACGAERVAPAEQRLQSRESEAESEEWRERSKEHRAKTEAAQSRNRETDPEDTIWLIVQHL